jgi:toxin ParE1/3/4
MAEVFYHPRARHDLTDVFRHIAEVNPDAAARCVRQVDQKARLLALSPQMGQVAEELAAELRRFPVGNYLIFYRPTGRGIEVVRVLHGARDWAALFRDEPS